MGIFPKVASPCPYRGPLSDIMDGDICRLCKKEVFDLTALNDAERVALVSSCPDELCVSYTVPARSALAALALGAAVVAAPVVAQDSAAHDSAAQDTSEPAPDTNESDEFMVIIVGGLPGKDKVEWAKDVPAYAPPPIPVVYEDDDPAPAPKSPDKKGERKG